MSRRQPPKDEATKLPGKLPGILVRDGTPYSLRQVGSIYRIYNGTVYEERYELYEREAAINILMARNDRVRAKTTPPEQITVIDEATALTEDQHRQVAALIAAYPPLTEARIPLAQLISDLASAVFARDQAQQEVYAAESALRDTSARLVTAQALLDAALRWTLEQAATSPKPGPTEP